MKYFKKLKVKHKVTAIGLAITLALGISAVAAINISTASAADLALDKTYGVEGIETQYHLMNLLRKMQKLEKKAESGDVTAQYQIGLYYYKGMNVGADLGKALKWLGKAHSQGHLMASHTLGDIYDRHGRDEQASISSFRYYTVAANGGLAVAQVDLGILYYLGRGPETNYNKALKLFIKASKQGSQRAEYYIGVMYELGKGLEQDLAKALHWYELGASGNKFAAYNAGVSYDQGRGTSVSKSEAIKYYTLAARLGSKQAQFRLGHMYYLGIGTGRSLEDAYLWLTVARLNGHKNAYKATELIIKKMTATQVRSAAKRIDVVINAKMNRKWF